MAEQIQEDTYYLCLNEDCNVAYYSSSANQLFYVEHVKVPIWFKRDADPKYICYCNQVTEQQILEAVRFQGARDMKDIIRITGSMKNGQCEQKNPSGKCCGTIIQQTIKTAIDNG